MHHEFKVSIVTEQFTDEPLTAVHLEWKKDDQLWAEHRLLSYRDITSRYWPSGSNLVGEIAGDMIAHALIEAGADWEQRSDGG